MAWSNSGSCGRGKMTKTFEEYVKDLMEETIKNNQHIHPLYKPTSIKEHIIDAENKRAAFVLFEQIDTDRCTGDGSGWLGDQFRHTIWYLDQNSKPKQIYEDHAYLRKTVSELTNSMGRDTEIHIEQLLADGVIAQVTPKDAEGGKYSKLKVKITLDGKIQDVEDFKTKAENLVKRISPKLGYDYVSGYEKLLEKNIAAIQYTAENGSTYGYDIIYLVWEDNNGNIQSEELTNSKSTRGYIFIESIENDNDCINVTVRGDSGNIDYKIRLTESKNG